MRFSTLKLSKDDLGKIIDDEDNLHRMVFLEQAIDAAYKIDDKINRSFSLNDCVIALSEFAQETEAIESLERIPLIIEHIENIGAKSRAKSSYAIALASFDKHLQSKNELTEAINLSSKITDEFEYRDTLFEIIVAFIDSSLLLEDTDLLHKINEIILSLSKGQQAYIHVYLAVMVPNLDINEHLRKAIKLAESIEDPISRSKVFLELSSLVATIWA
ncbi:MAG: hypothetical protein U9O98_09005 [Asgard group archaeon]|nr:hypothetical protein [Asgard group archaeon]